jgi:hypothetical protein
VTGSDGSGAKSALDRAATVTGRKKILEMSNKVMIILKQACIHFTGNIPMESYSKLKTYQAKKGKWYISKEAHIFNYTK